MEIEKLKSAAKIEPGLPGLVSFRLSHKAKEGLINFCDKESVALGALLRALVDEFLIEVGEDEKTTQV